ncbi:thioredoxin [Ruminococcus sp. NK3A76]|uniref:thioredoxin n=1 Tax=Ruminococcus sp. NK3A76 TaxID=877411 RepID=UPI000491D68B|nr:thioredoxin [Ruminococcus sp. NK3A76]
MAATVVTKANFEAEVLKSDKPVIVDFWASWCGPCRMLSPVIEEISETEPGIKVCSVNVDEQMELAAQFQISSIPTLLAFKGGQLVNQSLGVIPKAQILGLVK